MVRLSVSKKIILTISWLAFFCLCIKSNLLNIAVGAGSFNAVGIYAIIIAVILLLCIWGLPEFCFAGREDGRYIIAGLVFNMIAGFCFFQDWMSSWDFTNALADLGIHAASLLFVLAVIGIIVAIPFTASMIKSFLSAAIQKHKNAEDSREIFSYKIIFAIGLIIGAAGICIFIIASFSKDLGVDDIFSLGIIQYNYKGMIQATAADVHPPLYYIILKFFVDGVHIVAPNIPAEYIGKLVSVIPIAFLFVLCVTKVRKNWGVYVSGTALAALFGMPLIVQLCFQIRMYGWGMLFVTAALLFAYDILSKQKISAWIGLVIFSLCAAYTHYFALAAVAVIYLCLFIRYLLKDRRYLINWGISALITVIGYIPWIFVFLDQMQTVSGYYWIEDITLTAISSYISDAFGFPFFLLLTLAALVPCVCMLIKRRNNTDNTISVIAILVPVGTVLIGVAASFLIRPVFVIRYAVPGLFCLWLGVLIAVSLLFNVKLRKVLALIIFITSVINLCFFIQDQYNGSLQSNKTADFVESNDNAVYISDLTRAIQSLGHYSGDPIYLWDGENQMDFLQLENLNASGNIETAEEILEILESGADVYFAEYEEGTLNELYADGTIEAEELGVYYAGDGYDVTIYRITASAE